MSLIQKRFGYRLASGIDNWCHSHGRIGHRQQSRGVLICATVVGRGQWAGELSKREEHKIVDFDLNLFAGNFPDRRVPAAIQKLADVYLRMQNALPEGFYLYENDENSGLRAGWTENEEALNSLFTFAKANESGSFYALWKPTPETEPDDMPVIMFGDEGGQKVVAENAHEWVALLTYPGEPVIEMDFDTNTDTVVFVEPEEDDEDEEEDEEGGDPEVFRRWIKDTFGHDALSLEQANEKVRAAGDKLQADFDAWFNAFLA
jgi:hypothetical protein